MNFSLGGFFASTLVSGVGFVFLGYGKKKGDGLFMIFGIIMMVYPYFIDDFWTMMGIGAAMCAVLYWLKKS
jgi:hypothetical protein